jgi:hypothetical protein
VTEDPGKEVMYYWPLLMLCFMATAWAQEVFPAWKVTPLTMLGLWEETPLVVIGELTNIHQMGVQPITDPPLPVSSTIDRVYWCRGDFIPMRAIKGQLPSKAKYIWGSIRPGCQLDDLPPGRERVWFVREEPPFLRPTVDGGGRMYMTLSNRWPERSFLNPEVQFGSLLLTPLAMNSSLSEYANGFGDLASLACFIVGREPCIERIKALSLLGNGDLRLEACSFLRSQYKVQCPN